MRLRYLFPHLETERLVLREPRRSDAPSLLAAWRDAETMLYFGAEPLSTIAEARGQIRDFRDDARSGDGIRWIITERGRGEYIGDVGFFDFAPEHARAEVGFLLARPFWRRGLMHEALTSVLEFGFFTKSLRRVEALVDPRNDASLRVVERCGFATEGILRDYEFERGEFIDLVLLSLLQSDWRDGAARRGVAGVDLPYDRPKDKIPSTRREA